MTPVFVGPGQTWTEPKGKYRLTLAEPLPAGLTIGRTTDDCLVLTNPTADWLTVLLHVGGLSSRIVKVDLP
jgi:hypothetical protein